MDKSFKETSDIFYFECLNTLNVYMDHFGILGSENPNRHTDEVKNAERIRKCLAYPNYLSGLEWANKTFADWIQELIVINRSFPEDMHTHTHTKNDQIVC